MFLKGKEEIGKRCQLVLRQKQVRDGGAGIHRRGSAPHRVSAVVRWTLTVFMPTMDFSTLVT